MSGSSIIFVSNIPFNATKFQLISHLERAGKIKKIKMLTDPNSGVNIGKAFVVYSHAQFAENAYRNLNKSMFMGRVLNLNEANPKDDNIQDLVGSGKEAISSDLFFDQTLESFTNKFSLNYKAEILKELARFSLQDREACARFLLENPIVVQCLLIFLSEAGVLTEKEVEALLAGPDPQQLNPDLRERVVFLRGVPASLTEEEIFESVKTTCHLKEPFFVRRLYSNKNLAKLSCLIVEFLRKDAAQNFSEAYACITTDEFCLTIDGEHLFQNREVLKKKEMENSSRAKKDGRNNKASLKFSTPKKSTNPVSIPNEEQYDKIVEMLEEHRDALDSDMIIKIQDLLNSRAGGRNSMGRWGHNR